ncbi:hypothetical protein [Prochlorococcus sp. MIT 1223]|uniref:hypothetical protein n=1 Tax=Prochlorococcus sp. MIT 1223 TaxID=3096217 RepID=UPI002A765D91|nr:hypothetical protein [Prochlorococcus sp. MIT 1223]
MILATFCIIFQFIIFNRFGKLKAIESALLAIIRTIASQQYSSIFPYSDMVDYYWPIVKSCGPTPIFRYDSIASFLHCRGIIDSLNDINLIYVSIGSIFISLLLKLSNDMEKRYNLINNVSDLRFIRLIKFLFVFDPNCIIYTTVLGKDIVQFSLVSSLIYFLSTPGVRGLRYLIPSFLWIFFSRPYFLFFITIAIAMAFVIPSMRLKVSLKDLGRIPRIKGIRKSKALTAITLLPFLVMLFFYSYQFFDFYTDLSIFDIFDVLGSWNRSMGGVLSYPTETPFPIKFIYFWVLPLGIIQKGLGAFVFTISSLTCLYFLFNIFKNILKINTYASKFLFSLTIIYSAAFSFIANNSGITSRYRFTCIMPILFIFTVFSYFERRKMKQEQLMN